MALDIIFINIIFMIIWSAYAQFAAAKLLNLFSHVRFP